MQNVLANRPKHSNTRCIYAYILITENSVSVQFYMCQIKDASYRWLVRICGSLSFLRLLSILLSKSIKVYNGSTTAASHARRGILNHI